MGFKRMKANNILYRFLIILLLGFVVIVLYWIITLKITILQLKETESSHNSNLRYDLQQSTTNTGEHDSLHSEQELITISFVVCDERFNESLNVAKSVLIFTKTPVHFVIFTDDQLRPKFNDTLSKWRELTQYKFNFELHEIRFPEQHSDDWLHLFSKCAAQRLFIPKLIQHKDAMIYVDTDTLFLGPADLLWQYFAKFNSSQISAMTLEDDNPNVSWYPRFAKHPFYGKYGLNSGVMLMNLTRMRDFGWVDYVTPVMLEWKLYIPWGDQDIINIIFHYQPGAVRVLPPRANYRPDQCMYGGGEGAEGVVAGEGGVVLLHGSRRAFHNHKQPAFEAIYRAINEHELGRDDSQTLMRRLTTYLTEAPDSNCGNMKDAFLKIPSQILNNS